MAWVELGEVEESDVVDPGGDDRRCQVTIGCSKRQLPSTVFRAKVSTIPGNR